MERTDRFQRCHDGQTKLGPGIDHSKPARCLWPRNIPPWIFITDHHIRTRASDIIFFLYHINKERAKSRQSLDQGDMEQLFNDIAEDLGVKTKDEDETSFHPYGEC